MLRYHLSLGALVEADHKTLKLQNESRNYHKNSHGATWIWRSSNLCWLTKTTVRNKANMRSLRRGAAFVVVVTNRAAGRRLSRARRAVPGAAVPPKRSAASGRWTSARAGTVASKHLRSTAPRLAVVPHGIPLARLLAVDLGSLSLRAVFCSFFLF